MRILQACGHDFSIDPPAGIVVDSRGEVVTVRNSDDSGVGIATGMLIKVWSVTGELLWTHNKPSTPQMIILDDGVTPSAIAADGDHHVVVGGVYNDFMPWIQVYAMP